MLQNKIQTSSSFTQYLCISVRDQQYPAFIGISKSKFHDLLGKIRLSVREEIQISHLRDINELFLTLMMYKSKFDLTFVSKLMNVEKSLGLKIFCFWTCLICKYLKTIPFWKLLEYTDCTRKIIVLQTSTITVNPNKSFNLENTGYLADKPQKSQEGSIKYMVALSDNGHVLFCSDAMNGQYNDNSIVRASNIHKLLEDDDSVLLSGQMHLDDLLDERNVSINTDVIIRNGSEILDSEAIIQNAIKASNSKRLPIRSLPSYLLPISDEIVYNMNMLLGFKSVVMKVRENVSYSS